jgi:hypothetical protein
MPVLAHVVLIGPREDRTTVMETVPANDRVRQTLHQYVGDVLALESNIEEALDAQLREARDHPAATAALQRFHTMVRDQREAVRVHLGTLEGPGTRPSTTRGNASPQDLLTMGSELLKTAVGTATGMAAGWINLMRTQGTAKSLRDDFTAFNHAAVSYAMLLATAQLLEFRPTAELAERHLSAYERAVEEVAGLIPEVVAWELRRDGHVFDDRRVTAAAQSLTHVWRTSYSHDTQRAA